MLAIIYVYTVYILSELQFCCTNTVILLLFYITCISLLYISYIKDTIMSTHTHSEDDEDE